MNLGWFTRTSLTICASAALAGCASTPKLGGMEGLAVLPGKELPAPLPEDMTSEARPYFVGPFDKLQIDVFGIPELSGREVQLDESGTFVFPPVGALAVGGMTLSQIRTLLASHLRSSVRNPQVSVSIKEAVSQVVTIEGEVKAPGVYPVLGHMTLLRSMAVAQGLSEYAKLNDVVVFRTVGGNHYAALYNLKAIRQGAYPDPEIYANDKVVVGDSAARKLFKDALTVMPLLTAPILLLNNISR